VLAPQAPTSHRNDSFAQSHFFAFQQSSRGGGGYLIVWLIEPVGDLRRRYCAFRLMRVERTRADIPTVGKLGFRKYLCLLLVPKGFGHPWVVPSVA
jgi:hypothetical protein